MPERFLPVLRQAGYREIMTVIEQFESVSIDKSSAEAVLCRALPFLPGAGAMGIGFVRELPSAIRCEAGAMLARRPMASSRVMFVMAVVWVWHYQGLASIGSVFLKVMFCYF